MEMPASRHLRRQHAREALPRLLREYAVVEHAGRQNDAAQLAAVARRDSDRGIHVLTPCRVADDDLHPRALGEPLDGRARALVDGTPRHQHDIPGAALDH